MAAPKKLKRIKSWALEISSVEVFHYYRPRCHDKIRRGLALPRKALFSDASSTPTSPYDRSNPTGTKSSSFRTDYLGKGVEESQLAIQGSMVSGGVPRGFRKCSICQSTCSSPRRTFFLHALSFECTSKTVRYFSQPIFILFSY